MRLASPLLALAVGLAATGCRSVLLNVGFAATTRWSTPPAMPGPSRCRGAEISWTCETPLGLTGGLSVLSAGPDMYLVTGSLALDPLGPMVIAAGRVSDSHLGSARPSKGLALISPVVRPAVGLWSWSESPEDRGLSAGLRTGVLLGFRRGGEFRGDAVVIDYGWWTFYDVSGNDEAGLQAVSLSYLGVL